ncbi:MAG: L,D-transpeptidase family protein [Sphingomonadaceae bacterium]|nr:L,D-transpeptidase family protein [Sphingomonadaceae bacterium]
MEPMLKWIGGATAAVVLLFGGATLAGKVMDARDTAPAPVEAQQAGLVLDVDEELAGQGASLEDVIPADAAQAEGAAQAEATPGAQPAIAGTADSQPGIEKAAAKKDERFVIKRILPIEGPLKYGEWHWDDEGVPPGPLVVTVDLKARVVSVFRGGYEIGATVAMLGTKDHPTPTGIFPILTKERHNVSEKYNNAPMPYTLRLTWDGIAVHGGSVVENGYASHGCIAVPDEFASRLFAIARKGDKVIITDGKQIGMGDSIL